jgi:hypothetical protein
MPTIRLSNQAILGYAATADGQRFLINTDQGALITTGAADSVQQAEPITVRINWPAQLKR